MALHRHALANSRLGGYIALTEQHGRALVPLRHQHTPGINQRAVPVSLTTTRMATPLIGGQEITLGFNCPRPQQHLPMGGARDRGKGRWHTDQLGPGRAAYSSLIVPVIAMALSTLFEGYRWSLLAVAGGLLAMAGLFIALRARSPA